MQNEGRKEERVTFNYEFKKWNCETYCKELETDINFLVMEGFIEKSGGLCITEKGNETMNKSRDIFENLNIDSFMKFNYYGFQSHSIYELVDYIFQKYQIGKYPNEVVVSGIVLQEIKKPEEKKFIESPSFNINNEDLEEKDKMCMDKVKEVLKKMKTDKTEVENW